MTSEARAILAACALGLWVHPHYYLPRSWRIAYRYRRRFQPGYPRLV